MSITTFFSYFCKYCSFLFSPFCELKLSRLEPSWSKAVIVYFSSESKWLLEAGNWLARGSWRWCLGWDSSTTWFTTLALLPRHVMLSMPGLHSLNSVPVLVILTKCRKCHSDQDGLALSLVHSETGHQYRLDLTPTRHLKSSCSKGTTRASVAALAEPRGSHTEPFKALAQP